LGKKKKDGLPFDSSCFEGRRGGPPRGVPGGERGTKRNAGPPTGKKKDQRLFAVKRPHVLGKRTLSACEKEYLARISQRKVVSDMCGGEGDCFPHTEITCSGKNRSLDHFIQNNHKRELRQNGKRGKCAQPLSKKGRKSPNSRRRNPIALEKFPSPVPKRKRKRANGSIPPLKKKERRTSGECGERRRKRMIIEKGEKRPVC